MAAASSRDYASRDPGSSLRLMSKATNLAPDVAFYHQARADTRVAERGSRRPEARAKLAEEIYSERVLAARTDPLSLGSRLQLANAAMELACIGYDGKGDEAAKLYGELVATVPQVWDLHILLAIAYIDLQRSQEGIEVAGRLLSMGPDDGTRATALYLQSAAYAELGMKSKAIEVVGASPGDRRDGRYTGRCWGERVAGRAGGRDR